MLRCLIPASGCVLDVTLALKGAAATESAPVLSAVLLALAVAGAVPLILGVSQRVVGVHLPERPEAIRKSA